MVEEVLVVPDVACHSCVSAIERAVGVLDGVASVRVDVETKTVTVAYDWKCIGRNNIVRAIRAEGYAVPDGSPLS
ncbi:MAG TPA: heavy-metal-associated domain-containing protein [Actinomycetota bacterium]|nr:heavy-metal-associated domain-containing protein [Actinomycetota bacterium]